MRVHGRRGRAVQRLASSAIAAILTMVTTYSLLRAWSVVFGREPNPALVIWSTHVAMFWRLGIGAYLGGSVGFLVYVVSWSRPDRATRWVLRAVPPVAVLVATQGLLLP